MRFTTNRAREVRYHSSQGPGFQLGDVSEHLSLRMYSSCLWSWMMRARCCVQWRVMCESVCRDGERGFRRQSAVRRLSALYTHLSLVRHARPAPLEHFHLRRVVMRSTGSEGVRQATETPNLHTSASYSSLLVPPSELSDDNEAPLRPTARRASGL